MAISTVWGPDFGESVHNMVGTGGFEPPPPGSQIRFRGLEEV